MGVFIGTSIDEAALSKALDGILVTDEEFALGPEIWTSWPKLVTAQTLTSEDKGREAEFTIGIVKQDGERIGVSIDETEGMRITYIKEGGLIDKWNTDTRPENPELEVSVGYNIVAINGKRGWNELKQQISSSRHLKLTISRLLPSATKTISMR